MLHDKLFVGLKPGKWLKANYNEIAKTFLTSQGGHNPFIDPHECAKVVELLHKCMDCDYSYGGWMEDRKDIWQGHYHTKGQTLHVGVDYSVPAGTEVTIPYPARLIERFWDADQSGGWGGRLAFEAEHCYFILAHLDDIHMVGYDDDMMGKMFKPGDVVARLGAPSVNGGWFPHLHIQCMRKKYHRNLDTDAMRLNIYDAYLAYYEGVELDYPDPEAVVTWIK